MTQRSPIAQSKSKGLFCVRDGVCPGQTSGLSATVGVCVPTPTVLCWVHCTFICCALLWPAEATLEHLPETLCSVLKILIAGALNNSNVSHS